MSPESHRKTRLARAEELAEDYVEVIDDLIALHGEARVVAIAERLGVTHVTVTRTVARLQKQGLVTSERYRSIFLSESGRRLAARVRRRHALVLSFLEALGVDRATARIDAEGIEHHVSEATLRRDWSKVTMDPARLPAGMRAAPSFTMISPSCRG